MKYIMTYNDAMNIVSQYGIDNNCDSLMDTISMMEDNREDLSRFQLLCMEIVLGELEDYYS